VLLPDWFPHYPVGAAGGRGWDFAARRCRCATLDGSCQTQFLPIYNTALSGSAERARLWIRAGCLPLLCNSLFFTNGGFPWIALTAIESAFVAAPELAGLAVRGTKNEVAGLEMVASRCWERHVSGMAKALLHKLYAFEVVASLKTVGLDSPSEKS
jgi:hypothetical protein